MKKTRSRASFPNAQAGVALLSLIVAFAAMGALGAVVVGLTGSSDMAVVSGNQGMNAYYLAEAGYRYAASQYVKTQNENENDTADDEKAAFLENDLDRKTFIMPGGQGSFTVEAFPYWLIAPSTQANTTTLTAKFPGQVPPGFTFPRNGTLKRGDEAGVGFVRYNGTPTQNNNQFVFNLQGQIPLIEAGDPVYLVLDPRRRQTLAYGGSLELSADSAALAPSLNGMIQIGSDTRLFIYQRAVFDVTPSTLTLTGISEQNAGSFSNFDVQPNDEVVFKKCLRLSSTGLVGGGAYRANRTVDFHIPVHDGLVDAADEYTMTDIQDVRQNFTWDNREVDVAVQQLRVAGGGRATFTVMNRIRTLTGNYRQAQIWFNQTEKVNTNWLTNDRYLNYDLQTKMGTGNQLQYGALGLSFRARDVNTAREANLGLSFMKYRLPTLSFDTGGPQPILGCSQVTGSISRATATVHGAPVLAAGSWAGGNAAGGMTLSHVSGTFQANEQLLVSGQPLARVQAFQAFNDFIPDDIKPACDENQAEQILAVLWQQRDDGSLRWLAYKDLTHDTYFIGNQDCPGLCYDGQIVNDLASVVVRVRERHVLDAGNRVVKVNDIGIFYGDTSDIYQSGIHSRTANNIAYDILRDRLRYRVWNLLPPPNRPIWPPRQMRNWDTGIDYYSHLEKPEVSGVPRPEFQWDAINTSLSGLSVFELLDDGTVRLSELTTPDSGTYRENEVGMHAFGDIRPSPYQTAAFADFSVKFYFEGHPYGGFLAAVQQ